MRGELPTQLPGISIETGLIRCLGKPAFYMEMLGKFAATKGGMADEIRDALTRGDLEHAQMVAHSMKSTAGIIGAEGVSAAAAELERGISSGDAARVTELLDLFERELSQVMAGLVEALDLNCPPPREKGEDS